jgi:hypothetical protein
VEENEGQGDDVQGTVEVPLLSIIQGIAKAKPSRPMLSMCWHHFHGTTATRSQRDGRSGHTSVAYDDRLVNSALLNEIITQAPRHQLHDYDGHALREGELLQG